MHSRYTFKKLSTLILLVLIPFLFSQCRAANEAADRLLFGVTEAFGGGDQQGGVSLIANESPFVYEDGTTNVQIVLTARPNAEVTVPILSGKTDQATLDKSSIIFSPDNWDVPQNIAITGIEDGLADGNQEVDLVFNSLISSDRKYEGLTVNNWPFMVLDIDQESIAAYPQNLRTRELGSIDGSGENENGIGTQTKFWVAISGRNVPTNDINVATLTSANTQEGNIDLTSLTFQPSNWKTPQKITVTTVNDGVEDGNKNYLITLGSVTSTDTSYNSLTPPVVSVTNLDSQASDPGDSTVASILVSPTQISLIEPVTGGPAGFLISDFCNISIPTGSCAGFGHYQGEFIIRLSSDPGAESVTVPITSAEPGRATVSASSITFNSTNWNSTTHGRIVVTAINTTVQDPETSVNINIGTSTSGNPVFNNLQGIPVQVSITDLHRPAILVSNMSRDTEEPSNLDAAPASEVGGINATFRIQLTVAPQAGETVTVGLNDLFDSRNQSPNFREGRIDLVDPKQVQFTNATPNLRNTITVIPRADGQVDGNKQWTIRTLTSTSTLGGSLYSGIKPRDVTVTNIDKNRQGLIVTVNGGTPVNLTHTPGTRDLSGMATDELNQFTTTLSTFAIKLRTIPLAPVTINLTNTNTSISTMDNSSLSFDSSNWNVDQIVTLRGQTSSSVGTVTYNVNTSLSSSDSNYTNSGTEIPRFVLRSCDNNDNDVVWCTTSGGANMSGTNTTTEAGGIVTFWLLAKDNTTRTIFFESQDTTEGLVSIGTGGYGVSGTMTLDNSNWNRLTTTTNRVRIQGQADSLFDGTIAYQVWAKYNNSGGAHIPGSPFMMQNTDSTQRYEISQSGDATESGGFGTITWRLIAQPTNDVTMNITCSSSIECASLSCNGATGCTDAISGDVRHIRVIFTGGGGGDWNTNRTIRVIGGDDSFSDGNQNISISFSVTSADSTFNGGAANFTRTITNVDDEAKSLAIYVSNTSYNGEGSSQGVNTFDNRCWNDTAKPSSITSASKVKAFVVTDGGGGATNQRIATTNGTNAAGQTNWTMSSNRQYYVHPTYSGISNTGSGRVLTTDAFGLFNTISYPFSTNAGIQYWTGTDTNLTTKTTIGNSTPDPEQNNCDRWRQRNPSGASGDSQPYGGIFGQGGGGTNLSTAISLGEASCVTTKRLLCVEQP